VNSGGPALPRAITGPGGRVIVTDARWARTRRDKRRGLIGSPPLAGASGLVIERARQIHTFGMDYPIDVVFCDEDWQVRHIVHNMRPARLTRVVLRARYVLELPAGAASGLNVGDRLQAAV
jgi:uncharacterized membrane protein (UPF0127 family)